MESITTKCQRNIFFFLSKKYSNREKEMRGKKMDMIIIENEGENIDESRPIHVHN